LQNALLWKLFAAVGSKSTDADNHAGLGGMITHENGIHLYKSNEARYVVMRQLTDYAALGFGLGFLSGSSWLAFMPLFLLTI
jgi:hypothetical protein